MDAANEVTLDGYGDNTVDNSANISNMDKILEAELDMSDAKRRSIKNNSMDNRDGRIFPYQEEMEMYQGGE